MDDGERFVCAPGLRVDALDCVQPVRERIALERASLARHVRRDKWERGQSTNMGST